MHLAQVILIGAIGGVILGVYAGYMYDLSMYNGLVNSGDLINGGFWLGVVGVIVAVMFPRGKTEPSPPRS